MRAARFTVPLLVVVSCWNVALPEEHSRWAHPISNAGFPLDFMPVVILNHNPDKQVIGFLVQVSGAFKVGVYGILPPAMMEG